MTVRAKRLPAGPRLSREVIERRILGVAKWSMIAFFVTVCGFPFYYMVVLSFRSIENLARNPGAIGVDLSLVTLEPYLQVLRSVDDGGQGFLTFLRNSSLIAVVAVVASLSIAVLGAYAVSRLRFSGRRTISAVFLAIYLFPAILLAIPLFVLFTRLGMRGSLVGLMIVYASQTIPVTIYMLKQYFDTVPESLEESATLDGATRFQILQRIVLPLARPSLMATGLLTFMIAWNEFLFALLFLVDRRDRWTVSLGLAQLSGSIEVATTTLLAGSVILTIPVVVLFFLTERLLVGGLTVGAEKG
jgi:multiple sugar transport system permease protein